MKDFPNKRMIIKEEQIINLLSNNYINNDYEIFTEVPNMGQSVDLVLKKGRWLTFIEAKLSNWKRAIEQCRAHELVADFIYVAIASVNISDKLIKEAESNGYGIIHLNPYSNSIQVICKAKMNKRIWKSQRVFLNNQMKELQYEN